MYPITSCLAAFMRVIYSTEMVTVAQEFCALHQFHVIDVPLSLRLSKRSWISNRFAAFCVHNDTKYNCYTYTLTMSIHWNCIHEWWKFTVSIELSFIDLPIAHRTDEIITWNDSRWPNEQIHSIILALFHLSWLISLNWLVFL